MLNRKKSLTILHKSTFDRVFLVYNNLIWRVQYFCGHTFTLFVARMTNENCKVNLYIVY